MDTDLAVDDEPTVLVGVVGRDLGQGVDLPMTPHLLALSVSLSPSLSPRKENGETKEEGRVG